MNLFQHLSGILIHFVMVDHCDRAVMFGGIAAHINVFTNAALGDGLQLLVHHGDALFQCIQRALERNLFALVVNFALIHVVNAEHTLHQCGFARAVLAHQGVNRAGFEF